MTSSILILYWQYLLLAETLAFDGSALTSEAKINLSAGCGNRHERVEGVARRSSDRLRILLVLTSRSSLGKVSCRSGMIDVVTCNASNCWFG
jgi:hypothetical protein